jgi:two-component system, cell cycle response regulator
MKFLVATGDQAIMQVLEADLRSCGYDVQTCPDGAQAWEALRSTEPPSIAILDGELPGVNGRELCTMLRQCKAIPYVYVFILANGKRQVDYLECIEANADDLIAKPYNRYEMKMRVRAAHRILALQKSLNTAEERVNAHHTQDSLTGLWNRETIMEALRKEMDRARRTSTSLSIVMADLDHFKRVNDTYGHLGGDAVLREAAERMRSTLRPYDGIGRYGGEEFLIILPGCDENDAGKLADRVRQKINGVAVTTSEGLIWISISMGVASRAEAYDTKAEGLIRAADQALYKAKGNGRNQTWVATDSGPVQYRAEESKVAMPGDAGR